MTKYRIRRETKISDVDLSIALSMVKNAVRNKPMPFRYASKESPDGIAREKYFLQTPLAILI